MSLSLRLKVTSTIPIVVEGITPEKVAGLSMEEISRLEIFHGNRCVNLAAMFEIQQVDGPHDMIWRGDLDHVHWIGAYMSQGCIAIEGNAGRHLGSQMTGGEITVRRDAADYVGCEMTGGSIRIEGNAGDWAGSAYPGNKVGMNRGLIVIKGNSGRGTATNMRRGTICVGGNAGPLSGWNMRAGTLIIGGEPGTMLGKGMRRGSIILTGQSTNGRSASAVQSLPPTFTAGGLTESAALSLLGRWARQQELPLRLDRTSRYRLFHGDHLYGGRGEVLVAQH